MLARASEAISACAESELDLVPLFDRLDPECDGEVGLAHAGRPQKDQVLPVGDPAHRREFLDLLGVDRGLVGEVEALQCLDEGQPGHPGGHLGAPVTAGRQFVLHDVPEEGAVVPFLLGRVGEEALKLIRQPGQLQFAQFLFQGVEVAHTTPPMPATWSYSARSRTMTSSTGNLGS